MIRNEHPYALNTRRRYPLHDFADGGLPNNLLVDASLRWHAAAGRYGFVAAATVTPTLVVVAFAASPAADSTEYSPLGYVSLPRGDIRAGQAYAVTSQAHGFAGWVSFGEPTNFQGTRFKAASPQGGLLLPKCGRALRSSPLASFSRTGATTSLSGLVRLSGGGEAVTEEAFVVLGNDDEPTRVLRVRMVQPPGGTDVFRQYAGPGGGRPLAGTCVGYPLETINGVPPDCDGVLTIEFRGKAKLAEIDHGATVTSDLTLDVGCGPRPFDEEGLAPPEDLCP